MKEILEEIYAILEDLYIRDKPPSTPFSFHLEICRKKLTKLRKLIDESSDI